MRQRHRSRESSEGAIFWLAQSLAAALALQLLFAAAALAVEALTVHEAEIVNIFPHDQDAYTQGLAISEGRLYEGTGRQGQSSLRLVDLETGELLKRRNLSSRHFGEGITIMGGKIYQLTWRSHLVFVYEQETFDLENSFFLPGEGWGLANDGESLIVSDGSSWLRFLDPETLQEHRRVQVFMFGKPLENLNELEYIEGEVWANVWYEDFIARIDPASGKVLSLVDLEGVYPQRRSVDEVLNGIAWDEQNRRLFVTGKLWSSLFEIRVPE